MKKDLMARFWFWFVVGTLYVSATTAAPKSPPWVAFVAGVTVGLLMWLHEYDYERTR